MTQSGEAEWLRIQLRYVYNAYRTSLLNRKYYGNKLSSNQRLNLFMEIAIAIGATGSGVAGLTIWNTNAGKASWLAISGLATILSIAKPIMLMGKKIEKYTKLFQGHTAIYIDIKNIVEDIDKQRAISKKIEAQYEITRKLAKDLAGVDDPDQNEKMIRRLQILVNQEIPPESLWMP